MKNKKEAIEKWIHNHGACSIDIKSEDIKLYNGGLFQDMNEDYAELWAGDLESTIRYLQSLNRLLKKLGFQTDRSLS